MELNILKQTSINEHILNFLYETLFNWGKEN